MTPEQRIEHIEGELVGITAILRGVAEIQQRQTISMSQLTETISHLADSVTAQAAAADARMTRLEENLDGLIRAITAEHGNGKGSVDAT